MEIGSKRAELGIRDMVGWQNGRNAILMGTGKRMGSQYRARRRETKGSSERRNKVRGSK
jgi:hypothetical protein